jgi:hypothetical protein
MSVLGKLVLLYSAFYMILHLHVTSVLFLRFLLSLWQKNNHPLATGMERINKYFRPT